MSSFLHFKTPQRISRWRYITPTLLEFLYNCIISLSENNCWLKNGGEIVPLESLRWTISTFEPYKAPGSEGICPELLQKSMKVLALALCKLWSDYVTMGYIPNWWQEERVVFRPKAEQAPLETVEDFRKISLTSFFLLPLKRLIDRYLRKISFVNNLLCKGQHAHKKGKSADTALAEV